MTRLKFFFACLMAVSFWGCTGKEAPVAIKANVRTNQGDPVQGAVVSIDGKQIGQTDLNGIFETQISVPVGTKKRVEIKKESDTYYFAPYYESFTLADTSAQELMLNAVLYFVPKPSAATAAGQQPEETPETAENSADAQQAEQVAADEAGATASDQADPATIANEFSSIQEEDIAEEPSNESETAPQTVAEDTPTTNTVADSKPATTADPALVAATETETKTVAEPVAKPIEPADTEQATESDLVKEEPKSMEPIAAETVAVPVEPVGIPASSTPPTRINAANKVAHVGESLFTVHAYMGKVPLKDVAVSYGFQDSSDLKEACHTNARGRCVIRFPGESEENVTVVATRPGFKTVTKVVKLMHKGKLQLQMERGHTLDVYALEKTYNYKNGIANAEIYINGKSVGKTDAFGKFSYLYEGKKEDLIAVSIKAKGYLPEVFETDFVTSDNMNLVKIFAPEIPPPAKVVILPPTIAGKTDAVKASAVNQNFEKQLQLASGQTLFSVAAFKEYPRSLLDKKLKSYGATASDLVRKGWANLEVKKLVDVLLVPTVVFEDKTILELSMVDSRGVVVAAAKEVLDDINDDASIQRAVTDISKKVIRAFPFEGAVLSKSGTNVSVNLGFASGRGIRAGDILDAYGLQVEKLGKAKAFGKIATLIVKEISDGEAKCVVQHLEPRSVIERGDIVAMRIRKPTTRSSAQIRVSAKRGKESLDVAGANVYFNDTWIGSTDADGRLYADVTGTGTLKVIKQGFATFTNHIGMRPGIRHDVSLASQAAYLRVDSQPKGAKVLLDGKVVGVTPINTPVQTNTGFVKLQMQAPAGYKDYAQVLELDEGTLDLTGARSVILEKDMLKKGLALKAAGKMQEAVAALSEVPETHSDYLSAQHEIGQIFLTNLNMPARAAEAFGHITANEAVKNFTDKRFIGAHINEGVAIFQTAERLMKSQPEVAAAHYKKVIAILEAVVPHLRHVPADQYAKAVHNVDYYRALARHRLWTETKDPAILAETVKTWKSYIDGSARSVPVQDDDRAFVENAQVYYRQALASYNNGKSVSRQ